MVASEALHPKHNFSVISIIVFTIRNSCIHNGIHSIYWIELLLPSVLSQWLMGRMLGFGFQGSTFESSPRHWNSDKLFSLIRLILGK